MARTKSSVKQEEEVLQEEAVIETTETVEKTAEPVVAEPVKDTAKHIITSETVYLRSKPNLLNSSVFGTMTANMGYEIVGEVRNVYGTFYKLKNGLYVSKGDRCLIY